MPSHRFTSCAQYNTRKWQDFACRSAAAMIPDGEVFKWLASSVDGISNPGFSPATSSPFAAAIRLVQRVADHGSMIGEVSGIRSSPARWCVRPSGRECATSDADKRLPCDIYYDWARIREVEDDGVLLVRPGKHIAWRSMTLPPEPGQALREALTQVLSR